MNGIFEAFKFNIIDGGRYKLLLNGLGVTLQVALFSAVLGLVIGIVIAFMKLTEREGKKTFFSVLANGYIDVIRGTPSVVQLLIIYYIVFGGVKNVPAVVVAIIAFGINSGAYVAEILRAGILAVDKGQMEAGRSLGLKHYATMRYIIVPQAIKNILPALANEFIVLLKETAIVGYIALQDLTKAGDFIISRTYNAFVPLLTVAFIYFVIIKFLTKLFAKLERRLRQSDLR